MATMKAAVLYAPGDLRIEETGKPEMKNEDDVLVEVRAAGICGSDLERILAAGTYTMPLIPGHEFCGIVSRTGKNAGDFKPGDRVLVAPILPCFKCIHCAQGHYGQCDHYNYMGSRCNGGFAKYVAAPAKNLLRMPAEVSFTEGAAIEPAAVTLHGMKLAGIQAGDTVAVLGCGAIGLFAIRFAKILGAGRVIATDILQEKFSMAALAGADDTVDSLKMDAVDKIRQLTGGLGADVVVESAGTSATQEQAIRMAKKHGRILYLGTAHKDVVLPPKTFECIVRGELTLLGAWNSYSAPFPGSEWKTVLKMIADGRLKIGDFISYTVRLEDLPETLREMAAGKIKYNKIIVQID